MASLYAVDLGFLLGKIVSFLENEASLVGGMSDELGEIKHELISMKSFVEDSERKRALTEGEKHWVASVRDLANQIEDIIEEHLYHINKLQFNGGGFAKRLYRTIRFPKSLLVKRRIATRIRKVNRDIRSTSERRQRYGVLCLEGRNLFDDHGWVQKRRESSMFIKEDDLVGIEDDRKLLVGWLMDISEPHLTVISVVGMGGLGKTTLVSKAYNNQGVKKQFDCYAWITVSQSYAIDDLIKGMIKEFYSTAKEAIPMDLSTMNSRELRELLVNFLRPKRYVLVLDDVWSTTLWSELDVLLVDECLGSRVMLTTRNENIAASSSGVKRHVHSLKPLKKDEAWALFCSKAFSNVPNRSCPAELEGLAHYLVTKCKGLPLAIVALGGAMSSKRLESEWRKVYNSLNWELSNNPMLEVVKSILLLSFGDLPYRLKRCFLYCCLFPEDALIRRKCLIRLWVAEGFVEKVKGLTPEDVAESYLMEIISRNMLQVEQRNLSGRPKVCKMHDLMREVAISTSAIENFCALYDAQEASHEENGARRLSIQTTEREFKPWKGMSQLRSLLVFAADKLSPSLKTLPSGFRLLRVLDMEGIPIVKLPDEFTDFYNLRYLNLRGTKVKELPESIGRLHNLQTLDLGRTEIEVLPAGITKLQNLRHLIAYRVNPKFDRFNYEFESAYGIKAPSGISKLKNLQVLYAVETEPNLLKNARSMNQLTRLRITKVREVDGNDLCLLIQDLKHLRICGVHATEDEYLRVDGLSSPPPDLKSLTLSGKLEKVPHWFNSLNNLTTLWLHWSRMISDPLPYIQELPNLGQLTLVNAFLGNQLHFCKGFQKLKELRIINFPRLNEIVIEQGVMPGAEQMYLERCMELKKVPRGIEYLINLKKLDLVIVMNELIDRLRSGLDRPKVQHIPEINYYYQPPFGLSFQSLS